MAVALEAFVFPAWFCGAFELARGAVEAEARFVLFIVTKDLVYAIVDVPGITTTDTKHLQPFEGARVSSVVVEKQGHTYAP